MVVVDLESCLFGSVDSAGRNYSKTATLLLEAAEVVAVAIGDE